LIAITVALLTLVYPSVSALAVEGIEALLREVHWGEPADALLRQFAPAATRLPVPFDFGDSYADVVLRGYTLGGVSVAVFFQMDKTTRGLKRVQLKPLGHQINPPAFRAIAAALNSEYGRPDSVCVTPPVPPAGYQAAVEEQWWQAHAMITAIFRDTTLQAFEGCLYGPASGWCGLHGQILVRAAAPAHETAVCVPPSLPR
jgi:hypothetical protein